MAAKRSTSSGSVGIAVAVGALLVLSLAKTPYTGWVTWFRGPLEAVLAPLSGPLSKISSAARRGVEGNGDELDPLTRELRLESERLSRELALRNARIAELEEKVQALQSGVPVPAASASRRLLAERVGRALGSGTIDVRHGPGAGVAPGSVVVARRSQQLVGLVTRVGPLVSTVRLITDERIEPGLMRGLILPAAPLDPQQQADPRIVLRVGLEPAGDGTLVNTLPVPVESAEHEALLTRGAVVRLDDPTWPAAAQMYTLGRVSRVTGGDDPNFRDIVVTPELDIARVLSVLLLIPADGDDRADGRGDDGADAEGGRR